MKDGDGWHRLLAAAFFPALCLTVSPGVWAAEHEVQVVDSRFNPAELRIRPGDTVTWVNRERRTSHSVVFEDGSESERFFPGERWSHRFDAVGTQDYRCGPHPEMRGRIIIAD